ncbi:secreted RxLR effector protein 161-like [Cicer arietinum]|uniref:secreted RxLR effector protein 161-like n=1 Tax=Cicer arietinum TaxID=3827 RepID=UPI00032A8080
MFDYNSVSTPMESILKLSKFEDGQKEYPSIFKILVGKLRYLTCTRPDILYAVGVVSCLMEAPTTTHMKVTKRILCYLKSMLDYGLYYYSSNDFKLFGFCDSDFTGDINDINSTNGFIFFMGDCAFSWRSKKQPIVTLSTCESECVAATSSIFHAIWLRRLLK